MVVMFWVPTCMWFVSTWRFRLQEDMMSEEKLTEGLSDGTELRETVVKGRGECVICLVSAQACPVIARLHARIVDEVDLETVLLD